MASDPLKDFLEKQSSEGDIESEGEFTLTQDKALKKLADMCLADSSDWILKVVQAAVAAKAHRLSFQTSREGLTIDFFGLHEHPNLNKLKQAVLSPSPTAPGFYAELAIGLKTLLFQRAFVLSTVDNTIFWDGHSLQQCESSPRDGDLRIWVLRKGWSIGRARDSVEVFNKLTSRALFAPLTLEWDSRTLKPKECLGVSTVDRQVFGYTYSCALLYASFEPDAEPNRLHSRARLKWSRPLADELKTKGFLVYNESKAEPTPDRIHYCLWGVFTDTVATENVEATRKLENGRFSIQYTRLGVVCDERFFESPVRGLIQINADQERSDLSGLKIESPPSERYFTPALRQQLKGLNNKLEDALRSHGRIAHLDEKDGKRGAIGVAGGATPTFLIGFTSGLKVLFALKFGLVGGLIAGGVALFGDFRRPTEKQAKVLPDAVRAFNDTLCVKPPSEIQWT